MPRPPRARSRLRSLAVQLLLFLAVFAVVGAWRGRGLARGRLPDATLVALDGTRVALRGLSGRPTVIAVFAPWCGVCKATAQNLRWAAGVAGGGARVVSIAASYPSPESVRAYAAEHELPAPVLLDDAGVAEALGVTAFPTFFFVDEQGRITGSTVGYTSTLGLLVRLWLA